MTELNTIFKNIEPELIKDVKDSLKIKTRKRELTFTNSLMYKFLYSIPNETKESIVNSYNLKNNTTLSQQAFEKKERQISVNFYTGFFNKVSNLYKKLMKIDVNKPIVFASDGTFNNINSLNQKDNLETSLNMGFYDITNDLPLELNIQGNKNKNNELKLLKNYVNQSNIPLKSILVLDRAYCSYEFVEYLIKSKYNFIIRFRNNCKNFDKIENIKDVRVLKYFDEFENKIPYEKYKKYIEKKRKTEENKQKKENKKVTTNDKYNVVFNDAIITMKYEYTLLTNLKMNTYNDEKIKELYKQRWNIEIFFKLLKYNFKFEHLIEHNKQHNYEQYKKLYLVNLTTIYLAKIIEKTYFYNNYIESDGTEYKRKKLIKYVYKPNKSNTIKGVYKMLDQLFSSKLKEETIKSICSIYVVYKKVILGQHKERKAKTPFLKWYVKGHSNRSLMLKFIEVFIFKNENILNKNTKLLFNVCKITLNGIKKPLL